MADFTKGLKPRFRLKFKTLVCISQSSQVHEIAKSVDLTLNLVCNGFKICKEDLNMAVSSSKFEMAVNKV